MNCYNRIKALKERPNIAPGAAQKTRGMKITIITAEQRASFEMKGGNEAGELRLNQNINFGKSEDPMMRDECLSKSAEYIVQRSA